MDVKTRLTLREEKERLESQLADVPNLQERLEEICGILGRMKLPKFYV